MDKQTSVNKYTEEDTIDLAQLFYAILHRLWLVILAGIVGACAFGAYTTFVITPTYTSTAKMLVLTKETTLSSLADLQIGTQLTNDYMELILSRPVLQDVIEQMDLDMTYQELENYISVENPEDTRILNLSVTMSDAELACDVVNCLAETASEYIGDNMEVSSPNIFETGEVATQRTSPSLRKNVMIGLLLGALLVIVIICIRVITDDTIKNEDDVQKYLDIPVMAALPDKEAFGKSKKGKKEPYGKQ